VTGSDRRPRWPGADIPGRRIFVAVPLPADARDAVADLVERVRSAGVPGGGRDVRWVRLDGLHLTLRFIGPTLDPRIQPAVDAVRAAGALAQPFDLAIGGAGVFPAHGRPRALWLGLREGEAALIGLAATVDAALTEADPCAIRRCPGGGGDRAAPRGRSRRHGRPCPSRTDRVVREHHRRRAGSL
jgi:2'-5' RNA ligase